MPTALLFLASALAADSGRRIQLFPAGAIETHSGRSLTLDAAASALVARAVARKTPYSIDYDHASIFAHKTGAKAPAAGFFKSLEWVEGEGLFATDVDWTETASGLIKAGEYRYVSPAFRADPKSGVISALINAGLTNTPDFDGMEPVSASGITEESTMDDELRQRLLYLFNLPTLATDVDILAEVEKLRAKLGSGGLPRPPLC